VPAEQVKTHPRALLAARGIRPKKKFGQNFLMDGAAAARIARLALDDAAPHARVLEIGAGTGALTVALAASGADVTAIEIDPDLVAILQSRDDLRRPRIVCADALGFDYAAFAAAGSWRVAGNLPYNVATPLVTRLVEMERGPESITVMVQRDVAERFTATAGTPAYGSLSIAVQYYMRVERAFTLGPRFFYPPPKVDSTVVRMTRREVPAASPHDVELFRKVVRAAFAYRRKTVVNSLALALGIDRTAITAAMERAHLSPETRGEQLDIDDYAKLANALASE
jgi:16S rRNA (adenine1518-N6/adenine1519-N6)-dimethyltransferase